MTLVREIGAVALLRGDFVLRSGLELGGVPLATVVSQVTGLPTAFVRKQRKSYGTSRVAEGVELAGRRVTVLEDVVTSGGAILDSLPHLRAEQADVRTALCVVLRQESAIQVLADEGVQLQQRRIRACVVAELIRR